MLRPAVTTAGNAGQLCPALRPPLSPNTWSRHADPATRESALRGQPGCLRRPPRTRPRSRLGLASSSEILGNPNDPLETAQATARVTP